MSVLFVFIETVVFVQALQESRNNVTRMQAAHARNLARWAYTPNLIYATSAYDELK